MNLQSAVVGGQGGRLTASGKSSAARAAHRAVPNPRCVFVGAGLPANTVAAATVNGKCKLASRPGPFAGEPAPTTACAEPPMRVCRSGFTREYDGGGNGDRQVEIGQQARPFRG